MNIIHIVRGDFSPDTLNGVYKVIDCLSKAFAHSIGGGEHHGMQCEPHKASVLLPF